jgi:putative two-component system response regulator
MTAETPFPAPNILIVDDTPANLELLVDVLRKQGYEPRPVSSGRLAMAAAHTVPPDLILLDINMPDMNGFEMCLLLKSDETLKDIPVIFVTGFIEPADKVKAFSMGAVDYVTKPFQIEEVCARVDTHLRLRRLQLEMERYNKHLEDLVQDKIMELTRSHMATIFALAKLAESRDGVTGRHLERVQILCRILTNELRSIPKYCATITGTYIETICHAVPLHDIGKVGIIDAILLKQGKLSSEEYAQIRFHTTIGAEILKSVQGEYPGNSLISMGIEIAQSHHEKYDGTGYPEGLSGNAIPLSARIMALTDVYDALRSKRPYKPSLSHSEAKDIIIKGSGTQFDPAIVDAFIRCACEFENICYNS